MAVSEASQLYKEYVADGLATPRSVGFELRQTSDLIVEADGALQTEGQHYSVSGVSPNQTIVPLAPFWANGTEIAYYRRTAREQQYQIPAGVTLRNDSLEDELDRNQYQQQEQDGELDRAIKLPRGETAVDVEPQATRAALPAFWDASASRLGSISYQALAGQLATPLLTELPTTFKGDPGSPGEGYSTRAALAAVANPTNGDDAFLTESPREGKWVFRTGDFSAQVAADTLQGEWIAPNSDLTGASGAWRKVDEEVVFARSFGAQGDGVADDRAAIVAAHNIGSVVSAGKVFSVTSTLVLSEKENGFDFARSLITQANSADVDVLARVSITNASGTALDQSTGTIRVNGNRANNVAPVTGIEFTRLKKVNGHWRAVATECDTGIKVTDEVEYAQIVACAESCGLGFHAQTTSTSTPDELLLKVIAHDCDESLRFDGTFKMTSQTTLMVEGASNWAGTFYQGWHGLNGMGRGIAEGGPGGGLRVRGPVQLKGEWSCYGADDDDCQYGLLVEGEYKGTHNGSNNAATLTDSAANWAVNEYVGLVLFNETDGSSGLITANTATTITATLSGGTDNDWDDGDEYSIGGAVEPFIQSFHIVVGGSFNKGAKVAGDVEGSLLISMAQNPASGIALELGDASLSLLNGFEIHSASLIRGDIVVSNARNLRVKAIRMIATTITIGSDVQDCSFFIPEADAKTVLITNNRAQLDNTILFGGNFNIDELNNLNNGTLFRGMQAQHCQTFGGQPVYYDGTNWRPYFEYIGEYSAGQLGSASSEANGVMRFVGAVATNTSTNYDMRWVGAVWRGGGTTVLPS